MHKPSLKATPYPAFYFHTDINGAPEDLTSHDGIVAWKARYRTWVSYPHCPHTIFLSE
jgi:hypothetical protein